MDLHGSTFASNFSIIIVMIAPNRSLGLVVSFTDKKL